ncbi:PcfJ domain-containing protein [Alistipes putredinis]
MQLEALRTRKSVFSENEYFSIVTTCKQYQVIRFFFVKSRYKAGQAAEYSIYEVVQRWISPEGTTTTVARLRGMSLLYYDQWSEYSDMEVRKQNNLRAYDISPICTYPRQRFIPELKRNGFKGDYHGILPYDLFTAIFSDSRAETLLKAGQYPMLCHYIRSSFDMGRYWASVKICIRNGYTISDGSMWKDTIDLLRHFGKDTNCPKYVCPADLKAEHDKLVAKRNRQRERERSEEERRKMIEDEKDYLKAKGMFFGLVFSDNLILVKVIESVEEMITEGKLMHHCVGGYHNKKNSLILSATIDGKRIETIEVSLKTLKVVQSRGVCNSNTEYHDRIIRLVEDNAGLIRQRMNAA